MAMQTWGPKTNSGPKLLTLFQWLEANPRPSRTKFQVLQVFRPAQYETYTFMTDEFRLNVYKSYQDYERLKDVFSFWTDTKTALFILVDPLEQSWQFGTDDDYEATWCNELYGYACTIAQSKKCKDSGSRLKQERWRRLSLSKECAGQYRRSKY